MADQLSDQELKDLRDLLTADKRRQWLVSGIRQTAIWLASISAGYLAFKTLLAEMIGKVS